MPANLENSAVAIRLEKVSFHPNPKERQCQRRLNHTIVIISHASKVMLKILQARLQQYMNHNFQMFKLDLEKAEEPESKLPTSAGSSKKQESSRKTPISAFLTMPKLLTVWITINCGKLLCLVSLNCSESFVSFEGALQFKRMFKLPHNCTHLTH